MTDPDYLLTTGQHGDKGSGQGQGQGQGQGLLLSCITSDALVRAGERSDTNQATLLRPIIVIFLAITHNTHKIQIPTYITII